MKKKSERIEERLPIMPEEQSICALQAEIAGLKLTISELQNNMINQQSLLSESEKNKQLIISELLESKIEDIMISLAPTLGQLALLETMFSNEREVKMENIFKLVRIIESSLKETGLRRLHNPGEIQEFNMISMQSVKEGVELSEGQKVVVRLPGYLFKDKYIWKSLVDKI